MRNVPRVAPASVPGADLSAMLSVESAPVARRRPLRTADPVSLFRVRGNPCHSGGNAYLPLKAFFKDVVMPIYEYECSKCHHIFEEWVKTSEARDACACPECGAPAEHIISNTAFVLKGGGWYVTDYGYRKGVSENGDGASSASSDKKAEAPAKADAPASEKASAPAPASKPAEKTSAPAAASA